MFLSILDESTMTEALRHEVIDKNTGHPIPLVIWANDETGEYRQYLLDENEALFLDEKEHVASKIFTGNIELRRVN